MEQIQPSVTQQDIVCADVTAGPGALVVFGASGDLTRRKLLVSLFELFRRDLLDKRFYLLGVGRKPLSDEQFRLIAEQAIQENKPDASTDAAKSFLSRLYYLSGQHNDASFYESMKMRLAELDTAHNVDGNHIYYLAVPPFLYGTIVEQLHQADLAHCQEPTGNRKVRLVVEKPFGRDLKSAV